MSKHVTLPPLETPGPDGIHTGGWWHETDDGQRVICDLCPRACSLGVGDRGFCFVRQNLNGRMVSTTYGRSTGFCIDPIEKKPLNQFYPGTAVLSFGTAGCNLGCKFCQNWTISKSRQVDALGESADPQSIAQAAVQSGCRSVAFTYNDPVIWAEYAIDTARACHDAGVKTVAVTAGYITPTARGPLFEVMDAANVDLKGFSESFYAKLTGGHLQPVLDTLRWLVHDSDVWIEITNLVIPQANDAPDEIARMCDWIAEQLGPDVPIHFTAFHPDFRLTDRGATPASALHEAYRIAREAGLRYVYTGNVSDRQRQNTLCPACGATVIERNGYELELYALGGDCCRACGAKIAGRFDAAPGDWGSRRQPIRIRSFSGSARPSRPTSEGGNTMDARSAEQPVTSPSDEQRPALQPAEEQAIFQAAGRRVAAAVRNLPAEPIDNAIPELAQTPVLGSFVSLKRGGHLRSCCGFLGQPVALGQAVDHAAVRAAKDDPRFPPISPSELDHLEMEVWILWGQKPVTARGLDRVQAVTIGKHGLQIGRGGARGLLLPAVAVEHGLDALGFLQQVCRKAGLTSEAWMQDDTSLWTFEGYAIHGRLKDTLSEPSQTFDLGGPTAADLSVLAQFCQQNLGALVEGVTPLFYLPGAFDGSVCGAAISVQLPGQAAPMESSRISLRADMPLQSTLFELVRALAGAVRSAGVSTTTAAAADLGLSAFWDPAMQGSIAEPNLEGLDTSRRALVVASGGRWTLAFDPSKSAQALVDEAVQRGRFHDAAQTAVYSMAVSSTRPQLLLSNVARPQTGPDVRTPAVAGRFYPASAAEVQSTLDGFLSGRRPAERWSAIMVPHAGWIYSGRLAAETFSRVQIPDRVIIIAPKHTPPGADWAVAPYHAWSLPGGSVVGDSELAHRLSEAVTGLELDAAAHQSEHAIEVQLPILARLAPEARLVGIVLHGGGLPALQRFADQLAGVLADMPERPLLVISSDMNHFASDEQTRQLDRMALDALQTLDPSKLYETVIGRQISMCGAAPAVVVMETLRRLGSLDHCELVGYATSADASNDRSRVVGYAGMLLG